MSTGTTDQQLEPKPLGLIWLKCPYPVAALGLAEILKTESQVHYAGTPPVGESPTSVIFCPDETEDLAQEVKRLQPLAPRVPIVVFCVQSDPALTRAALQAGVRGFVHVGMQAAEIINILLLVSGGETVVPSGILEDLVGGEAHSSLAALSPRQREILELATEGLTNAQIGQRLYLSEITIKQHLRTAYKLLGVRNRVEAVMLLKASG